MPEQKRQSSLLAKLGDKFKKAAENHAGDTFRPGVMTLPGGVRGIAHVNSLKIGEYETGTNKGKPFFMAMAAVVYPSEYVGATTKFGPEPLCDTPQNTWEGAPKTLDDHTARVFNILHMIGGEGCTQPVVEADNPDEAMQELFDTLLDAENPVYISFETRQKEPDKTGARAGQEKPVNHYWIKQVPWTPTDEQAARSVDETGNGQSTKGKAGTTAKTTTAKASPVNRVANKVATPAAAAPAKRGPGRPKKQAPQEIQGDTPDGAVDETQVDDLDALAELADGEDEDAKLRLSDIAEPLKITKKQVNDCASWADVVELIREKQGSGEPSEDAGEPAEEPAEEPGEDPSATSYTKGDVVGYKPTVNGVVSKKVVNHEIVNIYPDRGVVTLKNLVNNQVLKTKDGKSNLAVKMDTLLPAV